MVLIVCSICKKTIDMPNKRFKMCVECSRQKRLDRCKDYKLKNKEHISQYNHTWKKENKINVCNYNREYNIVNRDKIQNRQTIQHKDRRKTDIEYKMSIILRNRLRKFYTGKNPNFKDIIGLSYKEFIYWIEHNFTSEMNWENHGTYWHIDHVIPCSWFKLSELNERMVCFNWMNMRPLEGIKNLSRKNVCTIGELLNHEISAKNFNKSVNFKPLITKLFEKLNNGSR